MSLSLDYSARRLRDANIRNATDSPQKWPVVMLLWTEDSARHSSVSVCGKARAGSGPRGPTPLKSKSARVFQSRLRAPRLGQCSPPSEPHVPVMRIGAYSLLQRVPTDTNSSTDAGRTVFKLQQCRREATSGRFQCALRLYTAGRVAFARYGVAQPLVCVSIETPRDSRSTRATVVLLKASENVRHGVAIDVAKDIAQSGPRDRLAALFEKVREFVESAESLLVAARDWRGQHTACMRQEAAYTCRYVVWQCARIGLQLFDGHFSNSSSVVAERHMGGFGARHDCASHETCCCRETVSRDNANKRIMNMRAFRGQRRQWFCFCGRENASNSDSWPLLPMEWLSRAVSASSSSSFKKRASFSIQPRAPSSRPQIAAVSTLRICDGKPPAFAATSFVSVPESLGNYSTDTFQSQAQSSRSGTLAASVHCTTVRRQRASVVRYDTARPLAGATIENARDSWSTTTVAVLLQASKGVRHGVATVVANGIAQSGRRGCVSAIVQKTRDFFGSAESLLVAARDCRGQHAACM
jgi:hypothetical protein